MSPKVAEETNPSTQVSVVSKRKTEARSTQISKMKTPKSRKRSTQNSKTKQPKFENEDPSISNEAAKTRKRSNQNSKTKHPKTRHRSVLYKHDTNTNTAGIKHDNESNAVQIYSSCKCISAAAWEARWEAMFWT